MTPLSVVDYSSKQVLFTTYLNLRVQRPAALPPFGFLRHAAHNLLFGQYFVHLLHHPTDGSLQQQRQRQ